MPLRLGMILEHRPIPLAHWSEETARGRQRTKDLEVFTRILLPKVSRFVVFDTLSKPQSATAIIAAGPQWAELVSILSDLGPDYTRTQFADAMGRACRFMYGTAGKAKSDVT